MEDYQVKDDHDYDMPAQGEIQFFYTDKGYRIHIGFILLRFDTKSNSFFQYFLLN